MQFESSASPGAAQSCTLAGTVVGVTVWEKLVIVAVPVTIVDFGPLVVPFQAISADSSPQSPPTARHAQSPACATAPALDPSAGHTALESRRLPASRADAHLAP